MEKETPLSYLQNESLLASKVGDEDGIGTFRRHDGRFDARSKRLCVSCGRLRAVFQNRWGIFPGVQPSKNRNFISTCLSKPPGWRGTVIRWRHSRFMPRRLLSLLFLLPLKWLVKDCRFEGHLAPGGILSADGTLPPTLEHNLRCPHGHRRCATRRDAVPRCVRRSRNLDRRTDTGR